MRELSALWPPKHAGGEQKVNRRYCAQPPDIHRRSDAPHALRTPRITYPKTWEISGRSDGKPVAVGWVERPPRCTRLLLRRRPRNPSYHVRRDGFRRASTHPRDCEFSAGWAKASALRELCPRAAL